MHAFEYTRPTTKEAAVKMLAGPSGDAAILAGGTDLVSLMKDYIVTPKRLVSLKSVQGLAGVSYDAKKGLRIGATTSLEALAADATVQKEYPSLAQAVFGITSPQIRNMGTVAGDLCQRPRCWYYRSGFGLLAMQNGKSMVVDGDNRYHAIFGGGPAYFVSPSSLAPALIALGATLKIQGPKGARDLTLDKFFRIPKTDGEKEYVLAADEIITDVILPPGGGRKNATYEVRQKEALDWPLAAASVALQLSGTTVRAARIVMGHVAPAPWQALEAEKALAGKAVTEETAAAAGDAAVRGATALSMNAYKIQLARVAVKRAILRAAGKEVA